MLPGHPCQVRVPVPAQFCRPKKSEYADIVFVRVKYEYRRLAFYVHGSSSLFVYDDIAHAQQAGQYLHNCCRGVCMHYYKKEALPFFCVACNVMYKDM